MKIIFQPETKGLIKALGLHHAAITFVAVIVAHFLGFGDLMAAFCIGWYARQEWGSNHLTPPKTFEIMDFVSPATVAGFYLYWIS